VTFTCYLRPLVGVKLLLIEVKLQNTLSLSGFEAGQWSVVVSRARLRTLYCLLLHVQPPSNWNWQPRTTKI